MWFHLHHERPGDATRRPLGGELTAGLRARFWAACSVSAGAPACARPMALADGLGVGTYAEGNWLVRLYWGSVARLAAPARMGNRAGAQLRGPVHITCLRIVMTCSAGSECSGLRSAHGARC